MVLALRIVFLDQTNPVAVMTGKKIGCGRLSYLQYAAWGLLVCWSWRERT
ncbi:hypothetical transporter [Cutibacterium acnes JCM 18909]|nr:hypothetical transporter [Cutibacterium acnes JCM 18909]